MSAPIELETLCSAVRAVSEKYHARAAYLFGSYARGEADGLSDLDVLIDGGPTFYPADIFSIAEDLYRAFGRSVDVYEMSELEAGSDFEAAVMRDRLLVA